VKAIETLHRGARFRSRLEARWAAMLSCGRGAYLFSPGGAFPAGFRLGADVDGADVAGADVAGSGVGDGNSLCTVTSGAAEVDGAEVDGTVTAGAGNDGATVVGTGCVSDCDGQSTSLSTAVMIPNPTSGAARHARRNVRRLPIRSEKERARCSSAAPSVDSWVMSPCRCAPSAAGTATGSVASSTTAAFRNESATDQLLRRGGTSSYEQRCQGLERLTGGGYPHGGPVQIAQARIGYLTNINNNTWFVEHDESVLALDRIEADGWRALHRRIREIAAED
jgi:hypothetical protein